MDIGSTPPLLKGVLDMKSNGSIIVPCSTNSNSDSNWREPVNKDGGEYTGIVGNVFCYNLVNYGMSKGRMTGPWYYTVMDLSQLSIYNPFESSCLQDSVVEITWTPYSSSANTVVNSTIPTMQYIFDNSGNVEINHKSGSLTVAGYLRAKYSQAAVGVKAIKINGITVEWASAE